MVKPHDAADFGLLDPGLINARMVAGLTGKVRISIKPWFTNPGLTFLGTLGIDLGCAQNVRHLYVHVYFIHHKE